MDNILESVRATGERKPFSGLKETVTMMDLFTRFVVAVERIAEAMETQNSLLEGVLLTRNAPVRRANGPEQQAVPKSEPAPDAAPRKRGRPRKGEEGVAAVDESQTVVADPDPKPAERTPHYLAKGEENEVVHELTETEFLPPINDADVVFGEADVRAAITAAQAVSDVETVRKAFLENAGGAQKVSELQPDFFGPVIKAMQAISGTI